MVAILRASCALTVEPHEIIMSVVDGRMGRVRFGNGSKQPRERLDIDRDWRASITLVACFASQSDGETHEE